MNPKSLLVILPFCPENAHNGVIKPTKSASEIIKFRGERLLGQQQQGSETVRIGKGRFINRPSTTGGKKYDRFFVYIPTYVATDERFPFEPGEEIVVRIEDDRVLIEKG